ncbi:MAG TPA: DUF2510 domain-containing protein [Actinoplanes sp.]|nr:DUF2510 domain-containing protein [Actinoplanes sp.]
MAKPAGWYADPSGLPARRWWDGRQWTERIEPGGEPIPPPNGFFPHVPPTGPQIPATPLKVSEPAVFGPPARRPEPPPPTPSTYRMPPVDAPAPLEPVAVIRQQRTAGFIGLGLIAVLVLTLTAIILLA